MGGDLECAGLRGGTSVTRARRSLRRLASASAEALASFSSRALSRHSSSSFFSLTSLSLVRSLSPAISSCSALSFQTLANHCRRTSGRMTRHSWLALCLNYESLSP